MATTITTRQTTKISADELSAMVKAGTEALNDGDLRLALDKFEDVVQSFPDRPEGHNNLGALYSSIGDFEKAEDCFDRVITILPGNANVLYNRGVVRSRLEKFDLARTDFNEVLELTPDDPDTLNNLGVACFMQGQMDESRTFFTRALTQNPTYVNAFLNHVDLECTTGNHHQAVTMCEQYLAKDNSIDVRRKHLELLSNGCRQALEQASMAAESILIVETENDSVREELGRISQAKAAWGGSAAAMATI